MNVRAGFLVLSASLVAGCMGHLTLPEAPTSAPYPVRVQAYNSFRPLQVQYTTTVSYGRYGGISGVSTAATGLVLANGANVFHPEDLLPMVGVNSPTAAAARESQSANNTADILFWSGIGASALGTGLALWGMFGGLSGSSSQFNWPLVGAGSAVVLGGSITVLVGSGFRGAAARHRETSYQLYDQSLRHNLGLCGGSTQIGDCATSVPSMSQPISPVISQPISPVISQQQLLQEHSQGQQLPAQQVPTQPQPTQLPPPPPPP